MWRATLHCTALTWCSSWWWCCSFYTSTFEHQFKQCMEFPAQHRYSIAFPMICSHFMNATHDLCPEEVCAAVSNDWLLSLCHFPTYLMSAGKECSLHSGKFGVSWLHSKQQTLVAWVNCSQHAVVPVKQQSFHGSFEDNLLQTILSVAAATRRVMEVELVTQSQL